MMVSFAEEATPDDYLTIVTYIDERLTDRAIIDVLNAKASVRPRKIKRIIRKKDEIRALYEPRSALRATIDLFMSFL